jgi:hypothetical protein
MSPERQPTEDLMTAEVPVRDDSATTACPMCGRVFAAFGRARYCSDGCRKTAWRRRRQTARTSIMVPGPGVPRRPITVYECDSCGARALGSQRCDECNTFMRRVGIGGSCPACLEPVALSDLLDQQTVHPATAGGRR